MSEHRNRPVLGVLGGMGALASAEFLKSIYEAGLGRSEQDSPIVALYSDPTSPDRTEAFLRGADGELLDRLLDSLVRLRELGASRMVICCMTLHHLLPRLPPDVGAQVISLLEVIFAHVPESPGRHLLICSAGARKLELFQKHPQWNLTKDRFLLPDEDDQRRLHELIYQVKRNRGVATMISFIESLLAKYRVDSFIAGCTEVHIVAKQMSGDDARPRLYGCVDPLAIIAREWAEGRIRA